MSSSKSLIGAMELVALDHADPDDLARKAIDDEIDRLHECIRMLKTRRNNLALVNKLPPEIFSEILSIFQETEFDDGWVKATSVCTLWRSIAIENPNHWTTIEFVSPGWELYLSRTKSAPLKLILEDCDPGNVEFEAFLNAFTANKTRVRNLKAVMYIPAATRFLQAESAALPFLQTLDLVVQEERFDGFSAPVYNMLTPSLQKLQLGGVKICWTEPRWIPSGLTHLSISFLKEDGSEPSQILTTLGLMPNLQSLVLQGSLPQCSTNAIHQISSRAIPLIHLFDLRLHSVDLDDCTYIAEHLKWPKSTHVRLSATGCPDSVALKRAIGCISPTDKTIESSLQLSRQGVSIYLESIGDYSSYIRSLFFSIERDRAIVSTALVIARALGQSTHCTTLDLSHDTEPMDRTCWRDMLRELTHISILRVRAVDTPVSFRGLLSTLKLVDGTEPWIPHLQTLGLFGPSDRSYRTSVSTSLSKWLLPVVQSRRSGDRGIKELTLAGCGSCSRIDLDAIRGLVDVVRYSERGPRNRLAIIPDTGTWE